MLAQDALVSALKQWPKSGIPDKPGVWLMPAANFATSIACAIPSRVEYLSARQTLTELADDAA